MKEIAAALYVAISLAGAQIALADEPNGAR